MWAIDFQFGSTSDGRKLESLHVLDEHASAKKPVTPAQRRLPKPQPHDRVSTVGGLPGHPSHLAGPTQRAVGLQHMREIIPTQPIPAGPRPRPLATALDSRVGETELTRLDGSAATAVDVFADTWTDAVIVLHESEIVDERYFGDLTPTTPHLRMSVTKSVVDCVAGILAGQGKLDPEAPVTKYVPVSQTPGTTGPRCVTCSTCARAWPSGRPTSSGRVEVPYDHADITAAPGTGWS